MSEAAGAGVLFNPTFGPNASVAFLSRAIQCPEFREPIVKPTGRG